MIYKKRLILIKENELKLMASEEIMNELEKFGTRSVEISSQNRPLFFRATMPQLRTNPAHNQK